MRTLFLAFVVACGTSDKDTGGVSPTGTGDPPTTVTTTPTGPTTTTTTTTTTPTVPVDLPPTVDAGDGQLVEEQVSVSLAGVAADDQGLASTAWTQRNGPAVTLSDAAALDPSFTAPAVTVTTTLTFDLTVEDTGGQTATDAVDIVVTPVNSAPVVDAGGDAVATGLDLVQLTGTATDADGAIARTDWTQVAGTVVSLTGAGTLTPEFTAPDLAASDVLVFQLEAEDDEGATASDFVSVQVDPRPNLAPTVDAGLDQSVEESALVTLDGTASDADGVVVDTQWVQLAGTAVVLSDPTVLAPEFTAPVVLAAEALLFELTVTDDRGAQASDLVLVTVFPPNQPPVVNAGPDRQVTEQTVLTLQGGATDVDGTVAGLLWTQLSGAAVVFDDATRADPTFTAPNVVISEDLVFQLEATDDDGATASDQVTVTVTPQVVGNDAPVADAGPDTDVLENSLVLLQGTATDSDGMVVSTVWTQLEGPAVVLTGDTTLTPSFTAPDVACTVALVFELVVTDDLGATDSDTISVIVNGDAATVATVPFYVDLETTDGGLLAEGSVWDWGIATSGPQAGWNGSRVWATNTQGNYGPLEEGWLCLPAVELAGQTDVTLSFRMYASLASGDSFWVEVLDPNQGWMVLTDVDPPYDALTPTGWRAVPRNPEFWLATVALPDDLPDPLRVRLAFSSDNLLGDAGAYIDEVRVDLESSDPDGDGLIGIRDELWQTGGDPFVADTDGDGVDDGVEWADGTDLVDPSDYAGRSVATAPWFTDLEPSDGGLVSDGVWEYGAPAAGPEVAHSGVNAWATTLAGNHPTHANASLYLPAFDLSYASRPVLTFRLSAEHQSGDATVLEVHDGTSWVALAPAEPAYDKFDYTNGAGWGNQGDSASYVFAFVPLDSWAGNARVRTRLRLRSDGNFTGVGSTVDDVGVFDETDDPDGDGLVGVYDEWSQYGTNPLVADTDGDGSSDGDEVAMGTDPNNPADYPMAPTLFPGSHLDFELDGGGLVADTLWEWGSIVSGPMRSWDGVNGWATNLTGDTGFERRASLYLPAIDLTGASSPTLTMRIHADHGFGDVTRVEFYEPVSRSWATLDPDFLAYDGTDERGGSGWNTQRYQDTYRLTGFSLVPWVGDVVRLRLYTYTDDLFVGAGQYIDEVRLDEEMSDPDNDGLNGVLSELALGGDPYVADTDGDGVNDGDEVGAGADPTNPAQYPGSTVWSVGTREGLTLDSGGLATDGLGWAFGAPSSGPLQGYSGSLVWATNLAGSYGFDLDEYLYLPPIDLTGAVAPSLMFRMWLNNNSGDGLGVELWEPGVGWIHLSDVWPAYDNQDPLGFATWRDGLTASSWQVGGARLTPWVGQIVSLRLSFRSDNVFVADGVYLDDFVVDEEGIDHDGDGVLGLLDELSLNGTDPEDPDSDGDGADDGVDADPNDPAVQ